MHGTFQAAVDKINALPQAPEFILHTADLSHTSKAGEYDTLDQVLKSAKAQVFYVPGEYDTSIRMAEMHRVLWFVGAVLAVSRGERGGAQRDHQLSGGCGPM